MNWSFLADTIYIVLIVGTGPDPVFAEALLWRCPKKQEIVKLPAAELPN